MPECDRPGRKEEQWLNKAFLNRKEYFDIAFCLEVFEYIWNPIMALSNINYLLKEGGLLYISFLFVYPVHGPVDQDYLRYTPRGAEKLLEETGFEILEMKPRYEKESEIYDAMVKNGMRPIRGYDRHHWVGCTVKARKL